MKFLLLCPAILLAASLAAQAQVLPVPGGKNPDWEFLRTERKPYDGHIIRSSSVDRMPNAAAKSIKSIGNHHYYWDDATQLAYDWFSKEGTLGPVVLINVRAQQQSTVYTYRRRNKL
jgi:hypothetical protein